jgi:hypothetical protein
LGDAEALVSDAEFLDANARQLLVNMPEGWSGWLGELRRAAEKTEQGRKRNFSLGVQLFMLYNGRQDSRSLAMLSGAPYGYRYVRNSDKLGCLLRGDRERSPSSAHGI